MGNSYSSYVNFSQKLPPDICVIFVVPYRFYGINLNEEVITGIHQAYFDVWEKPIMRLKYYNTNMVKFEPHKSMMYQGASAMNSAKSKQMFTRFHKAFCANGWSLVNSPTLTFEWSLSCWFYYKELNPYMICSGATDNDFCAISISGGDSLQFIDFPKKFEDSVTETVKRNWPKGIQDKSPIENTENAWKIKLHGFPWGEFNADCLDSRLLILSMIRFMSHQNWRLVNSAAMKPNGSDTLFFRNFSNAFNVICPDTMREYYFMLSFIDVNSMVIIGGDDHIKSIIGGSCARNEKKGIQPIDSIKNYPAVILNSKIWSRRHEKELKTRRLMTLLFQDLSMTGWLPTESVDCTRSVKDLSSIIFVRIQPVRMMYFCLCPRKFSSISLINATSDVISLVYDTFVQYYRIEKQKISKKPYGIGTEIGFDGDPFRTFKFSSLIFQETLAVVISNLKNAGWILMLSADTSNETLTRSTGEDSSETIKYSIHGLWFAKVIPDNL